MTDIPMYPSARVGSGRYPAARTVSVAAVLRWAAARLPFVEDEVVGLPFVVGPGAACLDIGAEYGLYTWALSALAGPAGTVHGVEPLPGPARWLAAAAGMLACGNVTVHQTALGERARQSTMSLPRRRLLPVHGRAYLTEGASGPGPNVEFARSRPVPTQVRTVDDLCGQEGLDRIDFMKIDVEGAEFSVLAGARQVIERDRPTLLLEIEDRHLAKYGLKSGDILGHLADLDYRMYRWKAPAWREAEHVTDACRNYLFSVRAPFRH